MADTATKPIDLERARKVAALLASDNDGEALAAARRLVAIARAAGMRVEDLLAGPSPASVAAPQRRADDRQSWGNPFTPGTDLHEKYKDLLRRTAEQTRRRYESPNEANFRAKRATWATFNWDRILTEIRYCAERGMATFEQVAVADLARTQLAYHRRENGSAPWQPSAMDAAQIVALAQKLGIVVD